VLALFHLASKELQDISGHQTLERQMDIWNIEWTPRQKNLHGPVTTKNKYQLWQVDPFDGIILQTELDDHCVELS